MDSYKERRTDRLTRQFGDVEEHRLHLRRQLAATFRLFAELGYDEGVAGHVTARDPELEDHFWVNPFSMDFSEIAASDMLLVNGDGEVVEGDWPVNTAAFAIHSRIHRARPDVQAAAHTHSIHGRAFSSLGTLLAPISQDACAFYEDHGLFDDYTGVVLDPAEGDRIAAAVGDMKACILRNHGLLTVGETVDAAAYWFISMDRSCRAQLLASAAGELVPIEHHSAKLTHGQVGSEMYARLCFQPMYDRIVRAQPDLLD